MHFHLRSHSAHTHTRALISLTLTLTLTLLPIFLSIPPPSYTTYILLLFHFVPYFFGFSDDAWVLIQTNYLAFLSSLPFPYLQ